MTMTRLTLMISCRAPLAIAISLRLWLTLLGPRVVRVAAAVRVAVRVVGSPIRL